jgi:hypothetical protein
VTLGIDWIPGCLFLFGIPICQARSQSGPNHDADGRINSRGGGCLSLTVDKVYSIATQWLDVWDDIAALPDAKGYGKAYDSQRVFGQTELNAIHTFPFPVIPAKAGIQCV